MTRQKKIKNWLIEQGYSKNLDVFVCYLRNGRTGEYCTMNEISVEHYDDDLILGIFKDKEFIKLPDFQDEPVDKALQEHLTISCESGMQMHYIRALEELNQRLLKLEGKDE